MESRFEFLYPRPLENGRTGILCRSRQSRHILRWIKPRADFINHATEVNVGSDFGSQLILRHDSQVMVEFAGDHFRLMTVVVEMFLFASDLEVPAAGKRTLNRFFPHDLLHAIYRSQRRGVHALSSFPSIHGDQFVDTQLQTSEYHAAVARTSAPSNGLSFQDGYPGIVLGKRTRRRQTGIPSADYCHVHAIG